MAQIVNEKLDGGEIILGKTIENCEGDLQVDCCGRGGLNSLIVDKTKLVIFFWIIELFSWNSFDSDIKINSIENILSKVFE